METAAQFDLNKAIQVWREKLASSPSFRSSDADELEMHLRDSIAVLEAKGLAAHEAFWIATSRLGTHELLDAEFGKVNVERVWIDRLLWMVTGSILLRLVGLLMNGFVILAAAGACMMSIEPAVIGPLGLILGVAAPVLLVVLFWKSCRHPEGLVLRIGRRLKAAPKTTIVITFLATVLAAAISHGAHLLSARVVPMQDYYSYMVGTTGLAIALIFIPLIILGWLLVRAARQEVLHR